MDLRDAVAEFLAYLEHERNYSPLTITSYKSDFKRFLEFLDERAVPPKLQNVTTSVVRQYIASLSQAGYAASTVGRRVASLKSLFNYLCNCEYVTRNPLAPVSMPKRKRGIPTYLSPEECRRLLEATDQSHFFLLAFRDKAILGTFIYTGLRRGELLSLRLGDIDFDARTLTVRDGKGGKGRVVPLCEQLTDLLSDWLELRPACEHDALFTTRRGEPLSKHGLQDAFHRARKTAGIDKGATIHSLRHSFATALLQSGADLVSLQRLLGHSSLDTTAIYLHVQMDDLREAVARHPLAGG